jgi:hypothetical protein
MLLDSSSFDPSDYFPRHQYINTEPGWGRAETPPVEGDDRNGLATDCRFKHKLVTWVTELRPPQKMCLDGLNHCQHRVDEDLRIVRRSASGKNVFRGAALCFVSERERHIGERRHFTPSGEAKNFGGSAGGATHGCNHDICIEHTSHIADESHHLRCYNRIGR